MPVHESRNIVRRYRGDRGPALPTVLGHKLAKKPDVGLNRRRTQTALRTEVVLIPILKLGERRLVRGHDHPTCNTAGPKVREQPVERRATSSLSPPSRGLIEKRVDRALVQIGE